MANNQYSITFYLKISSVNSSKLYAYLWLKGLIKYDKMPNIQVSDYTIYLGNVWENLQAFLKTNKYSKLFVLVDENTAENCLPKLQAHISEKEINIIQIPSGEKNKHIGTCQKIWSVLMSGQADRQSLLLNLGGGVIGDMGGFCASTFKRGFDFIQIPTTLLSQVDASIGGKLGIDFEQIKNSIGLFKNPKAVFISPDFLKTLPLEEIRSGFAELIKHGLIDDKKEWEKIIQISALDKVDWLEFIIPSLAVKKRIVEADPLEKGIRKALNFGHTIGHAVEGFALETDKPLLHGEAIAIGMIAESYISHKILGLSSEELDKISHFLLKTYGHYSIKEMPHADLLQLMQQDKKNEHGLINFSLIQAIGEVSVNQTCETALITESLNYYNSLITN